VPRSSRLHPRPLLGIAPIAAGGTATAETVAIADGKFRSSCQGEQRRRFDRLGQPPAGLMARLVLGVSAPLWRFSATCRRSTAMSRHFDDTCPIWS
jgi:hypothetical protein